VITLSAKLVANELANISETPRQTDQTWKPKQCQLVTTSLNSLPSNELDNTWKRNIHSGDSPIEIKQRNMNTTHHITSCGHWIFYLLVFNLLVSAFAATTERTTFVSNAEFLTNGLRHHTRANHQTCHTCMYTSHSFSRPTMHSTSCSATSDPTTVRSK
jgi:hypothetical protein